MPRPSFVAAFAVMVALAAAATVQGANLRSPDATFGASNDANAAGCTSPDVTCCPNVDYPVFSVLAGSFCRGLEPVFQHVLNGNGLLHNRSHVRAPLLVPGRHLLWPPHFCLCVCVAVCVSVASLCGVCVCVCTSAAVCGCGCGCGCGCVYQACKEAYVETVCVTAVPECCSSSSPTVFKPCRSLCTNMLDKCGDGSSSLMDCNSTLWHDPPCNDGHGGGC